MTDRLKLSDLKGDARVDDVARILMAEDAKKRIEELQRNIAILEKQAGDRKGKSQTPILRSNAPLGTRKDGAFKAISTAPSINKTPRGSVMVPVAYTTVQDLSNSVGVAKSVRFNGNPVYLLDGSTQPSCQGDEAGIGGGVRSGTVSGEVKPATGSRSVQVEGKSVVRAGDRCTMNGGNNPGIYIATTAPTNTSSPSSAVLSSNPLWMPATSEEHTWLDKILEEIGAALKSPIEGLKGAGKGMINFPPEIAEVLMKGAALKRAVDLEETAVFHEQLGNATSAKAREKAAHFLRKGSEELVLPKLPMNNAAQEGGNVIATILQIVTPPGMLKAGQKTLIKLPNLSKVLKSGSSNHVARHSKAASMPVGDGVKISLASKTTTRREKIEKLRAEYASEVDEVSTFRPKGLTQAEIDNYLSTPDGKILIDELKAADPNASALDIYDRASQISASSADIPALRTTTSPVVKIVPQGETVSAYSPFFTSKEELDKAMASGDSLAEYFGLPVKSDVPIYDI